MAIHTKSKSFSNTSTIKPQKKTSYFFITSSNHYYILWVFCLFFIYKFFHDFRKWTFTLK